MFGSTSIFLMVSKGETDQAIASTIRVHISTVERTPEQFVIGVKVETTE
ncbi:MAG: hypothetical protein V7K69_14185 [Nostoc sp.]